METPPVVADVDPANVERLCEGVDVIADGTDNSETLRRAIADVQARGVVVIGEGEQTLIDVCRALQAGKSVDAVAGLVFRDGDTFRRTGKRTPLEDLDAFGRKQFLFPAEFIVGQSRPFFYLGL